MSARSQVELEHQFHHRMASVENQQMDAAEAFGEVDDWIIQLGQRKAILHPGTGTWLWYDRLHDYWVTASCSVDEGILLTAGNLAGVKKLPQPGPIDDWCIYQQEATLQGPLLSDNLKHKLLTGQLPMAVQIWTPRAAHWLSAEQFLASALVDCWGLAGDQLASPIPFSKSFTIGRANNCDLQLADSKVSRIHARIEQQEDGYWISDLGSTNGVFVNQKCITEPTRLIPGDQIGIGDTILTVITDPASSAVSR